MVTPGCLSIKTKSVINKVSVLWFLHISNEQSVKGCWFLISYCSEIVAWIQWTLPTEKCMHEHKTEISAFSSVVIPYYISCQVFPLKCNSHDDKGLSFFHVYIPSYYNSTWHIIGSQKLSVEWINRRALLVSFKSTHINSRLRNLGLNYFQDLF